MTGSMTRALSLIFLIILVTSPVSSQQEVEPQTRQGVLREKREEKAQALVPYEVSSRESRLRGWEKAKFPQNWLIKGWHGFRPVIGGMPSGSGLVYGGGYIHGLGDQHLQFQTNARFSTKSFKVFDAEAIFPAPQTGSRLELRVNTEYRDLKSLRFFGIGNNSQDERTNFRLEDVGVRSTVWINPRGLLSFAGEGGFLQVESSMSDDAPSVDALFRPTDVPGFGAQETDFAIVGGWAEFDIRDKWLDPPVGLVARIAVRRYDDVDLDAFDFIRFVGDVKAYIPLGTRSRILALRARSSHSTADSGNQVPFYMMETLGGAETIRGFGEYRFRDTRNFLVSAEYRWEVLPYVDASFFFDAGKVFSDDSDFDFEDMHTGYGFGLRVHAPGGMTLRLDLAKSTEGYKFHIGGGPSF